jgi:hypothetical protein
MNDDRARMPTTTLYNERKRANLMEGYMKRKLSKRRRMRKISRPHKRNNKIMGHIQDT